MQQTKSTAPAHPPASTHELLADMHRSDSKTTRIGLSIALFAHVIFFAVNWPSIASSTPEPAIKKAPIRVLVNILPEDPPPPPEPEVLQSRRTVVPVPDETPHEAETVPKIESVTPDINWDSLADPGDEAMPPPPPPAPPTVARVHIDVEPPRKIHSVAPVYTEAARHVGIQGVVVLKLIIGADGHVQSVEVLSSLPMGLTESAVDAARQWVFEASTLNGQPTAVEYILTVRFSLNG